MTGPSSCHLWPSLRRRLLLVLAATALLGLAGAWLQVKAVSAALPSVPSLPSLPPVPAPGAPPSQAPPPSSSPSPATDQAPPPSSDPQAAPSSPPPSPSGAADPRCGNYATGKAILISLPNQDLTACQDGQVFLDTPVTTGRAALATPPGSYSVLRKVSPWVMTSPWPRGSPYWYEPSLVQYTLWFRDGGYAIHDAPWRSTYGPGTQANGTHGCVNVPRPAMDHLYNWADVGIPVLVS